MTRILFLDVDGAPFLAFEMLSLLGRGHHVRVTGLRAIPGALRSGELEPLRGAEVRFGRLELLRLAFGCFARRPGRTARVSTQVLAGYLSEPAYLGKAIASILWALALSRWAEREQIGHVHANWAHLPASAAWLIHRLTGLPFSFSAHAGRDLFRTSALLARKVRDAEFVVACNRAGRDRLLAIGGEAMAGKVHLCYHGTDLGRFRPVRRPDRDTVLSVGNLDAAKGFDLMIEAVGILRDSGSTVRCRIVGEGEERGRLEALIAARGLESQVELAGRKEGADLVEAYAQAAMLVAPSRYLPGGGRDGLPNVILEAMASGLPVIATDVGGIAEAVTHEETGLLVAPENPDALAAAIARVLGDSGLADRLGRAGRERVERDFDRSKTVESFCALFAASGALPKGTTP